MGKNQENSCAWKKNNGLAMVENEQSTERTRNWACVSSNNNSLREDEQQWQGREFAVCGWSATRGEEGECLRER